MVFTKKRFISLLYCVKHGPCHKNRSISLRACKRQAHGGFVVTPFRKTNIMIRARCCIGSISSLPRYYRLCWFGNVCRVKPNRLPLTMLFAGIGNRVQRGRRQNTWKALIQKDIKALSEEQGQRGTLIKWWDLCRGHKVEWIS